jgi:hypothetical protein
MPCRFKPPTPIAFSNDCVLGARFVRLAYLAFSAPFRREHAPGAGAALGSGGNLHVTRHLVPQCPEAHHPAQASLWLRSSGGKR